MILEVISPRCSGFQFFEELVRVNFHGQVDLVKTHDFPDRTMGKAMFLYRNPFDTLWETWKWWSGGSGNKVVSNKLMGHTFFEFIMGDLGPVLGFLGATCQEKDRLLTCRGMFYDPCRFWEQHVIEGFSDCKLKFSLESVHADPEAMLVALSHTLSLDPPRQWEIPPSLPAAAPGSSMTAYSGGMANEVWSRCRKGMQLLGYKVEKSKLIVTL